jgi:hypothetical protein
MNTQNFTYAFLAASALKQPFPAVMEAGDVDPNATLVTTQGETQRVIRNVAIYGGLGGAAIGGLAVYLLSGKKRRK